ncbi:MAG: extracellular solute-binding protein [Dactylosporangium sp.]|nr:extracellular solute-binding protein [Dactylosporangium sp.]NNJ63175.1 extracellular solute-binding protein [Dactylosporangium sp.]
MRVPTFGILLAAVLALGGGAGACDGGGRDKDRCFHPPKGGGVLVIWADARRAEAIRPFVAQLESEKDVVVQVRAVTTDLQDEFIAATKAGESPDIVVGVHNWTGNLLQAKAIAPIRLASADRRRFTSIAMKAVTHNKQLYGMPFAIENLALYRNTELVPEAPETIEEAVAIGNELREAGRVREALSMPVGEHGDAIHLLPLYTSGGAYLFGPKERATGDKSANLDLKDLGLAKPEAITAFTKIASLGERGSGGLKRSIGPDNAVSLFTTSQAPFLISGPEALPEIRRAGLGYDISPVPGFYDGDPALSFVSVPAFFLAREGRNRDLAQQFLECFLTQTDLPVALYEAQPAPPVLTAAFNQVAPEDEDMRKLLDAGSDGVILPAVPNLGAVLEPLARAEAAVVGGAEVQSTVTKAAREMAARVR